MDQPPPNPVLWTPSADRLRRARLTRFTTRFFPDCADYPELHRRSTRDPAAFWQALWEDAALTVAAPPAQVLVGSTPLEARWFPGTKLNFAQNLLRFHGDEPALLAVDERGGEPRRIGRDELAALVSRCAAGLAALGVGPGDRVAAVLPNVPETVIAMLATAWLGATFASCSPDFGVAALRDRLLQLQPRVLFVADGYQYDGKRIELGERTRELWRELGERPQLVQVGYLHPAGPDLPPGARTWDELLQTAGTTPPAAPVPFDHPLFVLFSSGTTGLPKAIVHGTGGPLLNFHKEHALHCDLGPGDVLFYYTTCGWMMWNWLVAALLQGAAVVLYDGSPFHPDDLALWRLVDALGVTHFGTSAKYLAVCGKRALSPRRSLPGVAGGPLRTVLSTGSPLHAPQFDWVYEHVATDLNLASISGGTDILGCFVLGAPTLPVRRGEIQCRGLGLQVEAFADDGHPLPPGQRGELVCTTPFPNRPLGFLGDPDGRRFRQAYFDRFPGCWHHGDLLELTPEGGAVIHGRSDTTLNPGGVRIGTAEIDRIVQRLPMIADSVVVGVPEEDDEAVILCVVLAPGVVLDDELRTLIRQEIRQQASPRHVPRQIHAVPAIPYTRSGKKGEAAVRNALLGQPVKNAAALANPEALASFADLLPHRDRS